MRFTSAVGTGKLGTALRDRRGGASIEYALLASMIAIAGAVGIAPYGKVLAQELSALSLNHLIGSGSVGAVQDCRRVKWSELELRHLVPKVAAEP